MITCYPYANHHLYSETFECPIYSYNAVVGQFFYPFIEFILSVLFSNIDTLVRPTSYERIYILFKISSSVSSMPLPKTPIQLSPFSGLECFIPFFTKILIRHPISIIGIKHFSSICRSWIILVDVFVYYLF